MFASAFGLAEEKANKLDSMTVSLSVQIYCGKWSDEKSCSSRLSDVLGNC
jgi:hypothetical protein